VASTPGFRITDATGELWVAGRKAATFSHAFYECRDDPEAPGYWEISGGTLADRNDYLLEHADALDVRLQLGKSFYRNRTATLRSVSPLSIRGTGDLERM
jgi:hypothetical protein